MTTTTDPIITWKRLDPAHSSAEFKVRHMMISNVKGSFSGIIGTLTEDTSNPRLSQVDATIDISTINTGDAQRDEHLKSADFFHRRATSLTWRRSTLQESKRKVRENTAVTGDLTAHRVVKQSPEVFAVEGPSMRRAKILGGILVLVCPATTKINRKDFGLTWNATLEAGRHFGGRRGADHLGSTAHQILRSPVVQCIRRWGALIARSKAKSSQNPIEQ